VRIIEEELCPNYIHMLLEIPPKFSVSGVVGFLKGKSSLLIHERRGNLKYKYGNRSFWCRGYCSGLSEGPESKSAKKTAFSSYFSTLEIILFPLFRILSKNNYMSTVDIYIMKKTSNNLQSVKCK